jgi:hypothetical protein
MYLPRTGRASDTRAGRARVGQAMFPKAVLGRRSDPVEGGSANDYDYANGDPINQFDLSGLGPCPPFLHRTRSDGSHYCKGNAAASPLKEVGGAASRGAVNVTGRAWGGVADLAGGQARSCGDGITCIDNSRAIVPWADAGTFGNTIVCRGMCTDEIVAHESVHVRQFQDGGVAFPPAYVWESLYGGYQCGNKYERSAYSAGLGPC